MHCQNRGEEKGREGGGHSEYFLSPIRDAGSGLAQTWLGRICLPERPTVVRITPCHEPREAMP